MTFEIENVAAQAKEQEDAKGYWGSSTFESYKLKQPWSDFIVDEILKFEPKSVLEFGCNVGKNILVLNERAPATFTAGIDVNAAATAFGRDNGLNLAAGDEHSLAIMPDQAFDVAFTVSVIDHVATPEAIVRQLARVSKRAILLLEPWLGQEGKVTKNLSRKTGKMINTTPYSYSWDYRRIAAECLPGWSLEEKPYKLESNLGRYYVLYTITRP